MGNLSKIVFENVSFSYPGSHKEIFKDLDFEIDTNWKLGLIGRNGDGKTTLLRLLADENKKEYSGKIVCESKVEYFPYAVQNSDATMLKVLKEMIAPFIEWEEQMVELQDQLGQDKQEKYFRILDLFMEHDGYIIEEKIKKELFKIGLSEKYLSKPFSTLSEGEKTKAQIVALFLKKETFLLIDEPTNHLDVAGRLSVGKYLCAKSGFVLVSHDADFLNLCTDHILFINNNQVTIQRGNFDIWKQNWDRLQLNREKIKDGLEQQKNKMDIQVNQLRAWEKKAGEKSEVKIAKKVKHIEKERELVLTERNKIGSQLTEIDSLKMNCSKQSHELLLSAHNISYDVGQESILEQIQMEIKSGERILISGINGSGKTTLVKILIGEIKGTGTLYKRPELKISYIPQITSGLIGSVYDFSDKHNLNPAVLVPVLRQLGVAAQTLEKNMKDFSEGEKKKVYIAKSIMEESDLYIWDEPLNYLDIIARVQIEEMVNRYNPTMIFIEHDLSFSLKIATREFCC